jgi:tetratricopeptide (TPR) repeat protein
MGIVYRAIDTVLQRPVALKMLQVSARDAHRSLLREARAASALNHPNICTIYEVGQHEGCSFIAMEYVDGRQVGELIPEDGLPAESVVRLGLQVAQAIEYAHRHHLIHRDLKSANVLVSGDGRAKVLDFGLASTVAAVDGDALTRTSPVDMNPAPFAGTLPYMSPELLRGGVAHTQSDVWALGVVLYEMTAGHLPFQGPTPVKLTDAILNHPVPALSMRVPLGLRAIVLRCLERDLAHRYRDAGEVRVALETVQSGTDSGLLVRDDGPVVMSKVAWRRRTIAIVGAAVLLIAIAAAILVVPLTRPPVLTERDRLLVADFINTTGDSVFDDALRQALSIHLEQTPFLSVVSRDEIRETLRLMRRQPGERLLDELARDACQRVGATAMVEGSIAPLGSHYGIGLNALTCGSGETMASEQAEAASREQILTVLGAAASRLRRKLGESLPTLQRFDTPILQATTHSLEALKAFSMGEEVRARDSEYDAVAFYRRALDIDPDFATVYARLSAVYLNLGQPGEHRRMAAEAYARRDRVSERERFYIDGRHCLVTNDPLACYANVYELWTRIYPRDALAHGNLSDVYYGMGKCDKSLEPALAAFREEVTHTHSQPYSFVAQSYMCLGRVAEARRVIDDAVARKLESPFISLVRFRVAFFQRDEAALMAVRQWASGRGEESIVTEFDADAAAFDGLMRRARELRLRAEQLAAARLPESVWPIRARGAFYEAAQGDFARARTVAASIGDSRPTAVFEPLIAAAVIAADRRRTDALLLAQEQQQGAGAPQRSVLEPIVRVLDAVNRGERFAVSRLPPADTRELRLEQSFRPVYLRGLSYLSAGDPLNAAGEFQRILDHRGSEPLSPLYPLAHVQQARAFVRMGEQAKARKAYQDFFALWKSADPDIPILRDAREEYARLDDARQELR